ncbi:sulfotransferase family protein [Nocardioides stalactiti]|uniref:sulfotransferase family protein n=1 Tax=Nocardioides stalactiti TaxID=2755356 RepID=UPI0015FFA335|nr:sulfotransferase [Nocardioides stalactiti]
MASGRFYFDWDNYRTMVSLLAQQRGDRRGRAIHRAFKYGLPLVAAVHAGFFALDPVVSPALRRTEVRRPVFSIGHARSGTTYQHRLMASDPQFSYLLMYEMFFPSLIEKRILRGLLAVDEQLGGRVRKRIQAAEEKALAETNDMHRTGLFVAEEDEFLLTFSLGSGFWMVLFPYLDRLDFHAVDRWPEEKRRKVMAFYKECVRRQLVLTGKPVHLSKNANFSGRMESLIETFPDARVVIPIRNPYQTVPSLMKMMQTAWRQQGHPEELIRASLRTLADQSYETYEHPLEVLARHPEVRASVLDYRDLVADPGAAMRRVYADLDLDLTPEQEASFAAAGDRGHETAHRYSLEEFGLDKDEIHERLADLFDTYQWDTEGSDVR